MIVLFYRAEARESALPPLPEGTELRHWRPASGGLPPLRRYFAENCVWHAMNATQGFANPDFRETTIWRGDRLCHRLVLTPRWYRFPFMAASDLQIGAVWTATSERRSGLARHAVSEALGSAGDGRAVWYLANATNPASCALAEACGMRLFATGTRTASFGLRMFGQFGIVREV